MTDTLELAKAKIQEIKPKIERLTKELSLWEQFLELEEPVRKVVAPLIAKVETQKRGSEPSLRIRVMIAINESPTKHLSTKSIIEAVSPMYTDKTYDQLKSRISPILSENKVTDKNPNGWFIPIASTNRKAGFEWGLSEKGKAALEAASK